MPDTDAAYNLALDYLYSFVDYSLKHSSELAKADFNLDRMRALMAETGNPQDTYRIVHVAGTKGKGSVCALTASGLRAAGFRTGLYTSPHLVDYCERIQVNGVPIPHGRLAELVASIKPAVGRIPKLTTFEITTALAFMYFASEKVEAAVVEVGLGGRLDATNVVTPSVAAITSLSYDHMAVLGDTLTKIATEKAGIIKIGIPVVSAPQKDEALQVLQQIAEERGASFTLVGREVKFKPLDHSLDGQSLRVTWRQESLTLNIPLLGVHQVQNAAVAATALWILRGQGLEIHNTDIQTGFGQVQWPARFQVVRREPPVILDSAHNQDSFSRLHQALEDYFPRRRIYLIFGASEDKNIPGMFKEIKPRVRKLFITKADQPRALAPELIGQLADKAGLAYEIIVPVKAAAAYALELSEKDGSIVVSAGSMFVTAEVMAAWQAMEPRPARTQS
jgi:dihydrofolate synthase/folylpolyglutamate synthase